MPVSVRSCSLPSTILITVLSSRSITGKKGHDSDMLQARRLEIRFPVSQSRRSLGFRVTHLLLNYLKHNTALSRLRGLHLRLQTEVTPQQRPCCKLTDDPLFRPLSLRSLDLCGWRGLSTCEEPASKQIRKEPENTGPETKPPNPIPETHKDSTPKLL